MASTYTIALGSIIGIITWIFLAFKVPGIPFGRTLGTLLGAVLIVVFGVLSPVEAFEAVNIETIALLFGTMVLSILLERESFFERFIKVLTWRCTTAQSLLARVCVASGVLSALMTNDTVCVFFTPVVVELCERYELPHGPFLIALATSANIGSTATPVGNPQNMIIATLSGISYGQFIIYIGPAMLVTLELNILCLWLWYHGELKGKELRVCNAKFARATEEQMALISQSKALETISTADNDSNVSEKPTNDQSTMLRRHERKENGHDHTNTISTTIHLTTPVASPLQYLPFENSSQAQREAHRGEIDEQIRDRELERRIKQEPKQEHEHERVEERKTIELLTMKSIPPTSPLLAVRTHLPLQQPQSQPPSQSSVSVAKPAEISGDDLALVIYEMQCDYWHDDPDSVAKGKPAHSETHPHTHSDSKSPLTRIADRHHPRLTGRTLIMQPIAMTPTQVRELKLRRLRQRYEQNESVIFDKEILEDHPLFDVAKCLPGSWGKRLLLFPLPSKLVLFFLILLGTVGAFAGGANLGWAALGGAAAMLIVDWRDPDAIIAQVDWSLLVFFSSLFIVTAGFSATELPDDVWNALRGQIDVGEPRGILIYSIIIIVGSNTVSNVPLVLLLGPSIPSLANPLSSWLLLSFVSTVAGNLTLVGSVANLIVCARAKHAYLLGFWEYLRFGFPTTLVVTAVGAIIVKLLSSIG